MVLIALKRTIVLMILTAIGVVCTKKGLITRERSKGVSDLILYILTPSIIVSSLQIEYDEEHILGFLLVFVCTLIAYSVNEIIAKTTIRIKDEDTRMTMRFSAIFPNAAFMGIPMVQAIIGEEGVFYLAAAVAALNLLVFTWDVSYMEKDKSKVGIKECITSPTVLAVIIGTALFMMRIRLPELILTPITMLGNAVTPMAMLVAGYSIANTDFRKAGYRLPMAFSIMWKLLCFPILFAIALSLIPGFNIPKLAAVICLSCPTGAYTVFLSVKYDRNDSVASQMFTYTTILSILSIPVIMWICTLLGYHI